jgi:16S rRNA (cytosine967-C5)-methyltransferase
MTAPYHAAFACAINGRMDPTRLLALSLLRAVFERHRPLDEALDALPPADPRDRAAAHRIAATVLRRAGTLDAVLEPYIKRSPPDAVRLILRLGAAQLLFLQTPAHAAVATSVELARAQKLVPFAGLVNAVLRRVAESGAAMLPDLDSPRLDTPGWLWAAWGARARAIAMAHQQEAPLDLTLLADTPPPEAMRLPNGSIRFPPGTRVADIPAFAAGQAWVQDAAAALPALLLAARPGEQVADLCAAPGGKTAQLAAAGAHVTAIESNERRIPRLRENLDRLTLRADIIQADATLWRPPAPLDAILLDAPCSATGTIRRHPDILHIKRETDLPGLVAAQDRLVQSASDMLRPGGRLIYAVCSLQPEEGPHRAEAAARFGLTRSPFTEAELQAIPEARTERGEMRTDPAMWGERGGVDGFFAVRFVKK